MMLLLDELAEGRIEQAIARGELDDLPGRGTPLQLDDDQFVPPSLRAAYRVLKNAGFAPPEIRLWNEIRSVEELLGQLGGDDRRRNAAARRLSLLRARLGALRGERLDLAAEDRYGRKLNEKLAR